MASIVGGHVSWIAAIFDGCYLVDPALVAAADKLGRQPRLNYLPQRNGPQQVA